VPGTQHSASSSVETIRSARICYLNASEGIGVPVSRS